MEEKKKRKPKAAAEGEGREHKKNWREEYATVDDIRTFLDSQVMLRYNLVTQQVECHLLNGDPWESYDGSPGSAMQLLMAMTEQGGGDDSGCQPMLWRPLTDRILNSLWARLSRQKPARLQDICHMVDSDYVAEYHPMRHYLEHLPPWDGRRDYIMEMSLSVQVKGDVEEQMRFADYLKKWLVAMVAGWVDDEAVNHVILTFVGEQGIYKTTWFNYILPPELQRYFCTKTNAGRMTKDDLIALSQYGLVCYEELDTMSPRELNQLKSAVTMPTVNERAPYDRYPRHRRHKASFCGTGNNTLFLSDDTGNRRWLPFEVERIESPRDHPFDYTGIYSQAYTLYRQGFRYWFSQEEMLQLTAHNRHFETSQDELELVDYYFRQPSGGDAGEFMPTAVARQIVTTPGTRVSTVALGRAFCRLGFRKGVENGCRGYYVVRRTDEERRMRAHSLAIASRDIQMTDDTDET